MTRAELVSNIVEPLGWVLVHSVWQLALIVVAGMILASVMRRTSAAFRYLGLLGVLGMTIVAPIATWFVLAPDLEQSALVANATVPDSARAVATEADPRSVRDARLPITGTPQAALQPISLLSEPGVTVSSLSADDWWSWVAQRVRPWLSWLVIAWSVGVVAFALRPLMSAYMVQRLRKLGVTTVPDSLVRSFDQIASSLQIRRSVALLQSTLVQVPAVVGYFRPVVLLPASAVTGLSASHLEAILAHELAHVRRHDYLVNFLQTLVEALFFYHPLIWWLSHRIRCEREHCCDDIAVSATGDRVEYSRALLALEEQRDAALALAMSANGGSLLARVRRLLGTAPPYGLLGGDGILGTAVLALAGGIVAWGISIHPSTHATADDTPTPADVDTVATPKPEEEWTPLFNGRDLEGWFVEGDNPDAWQVQDGVLVVDSRIAANDALGIHAPLPPRYGFLLTNQTYREFKLRFEYQISDRGNSGFAFWATAGEKVFREGPIHPEIKLIDDTGYLTCFRFFGQWILLFWTARGEPSDVESQVAYSR